MELQIILILQISAHGLRELLQIPINFVFAGADDGAIRGNAGQLVKGARVAVGQIGRPEFFCALAKIHEVLLVDFFRQMQLFRKWKARGNLTDCPKGYHIKKAMSIKPIGKSKEKETRRKLPSQPAG